MTSLYEKFDLYDDSLDAVSSFFDSLSESKFCRDIDLLLTDRGLGLHETTCFIAYPEPPGFDPSLPAGYVRFAIDIIDAESIITYEDFLEYLRQACEGYIARHPQDEAKLVAVLQKHDIALRP